MRKILLVDDDVNLLSMLGDFLSGEGYDVTMAESGEQALLQLSHLSPDLIILDMMMPGIGGMGVLDHLVLPDGTFRYPILVLTAKAAMAEYFADKQVDGFLAKPCDPEDLKGEVGRIIFQSSGEHKPSYGEKPLLYIADSSVSRRMTLAGALEKAGYNVIQYGTGAELVQSMVLTPPSIIVSSLELSDQSANVLVSLAKAMAATASCKCIVYGVGLPGAKLEHVTALDNRKCHIVSGDGEIDILAAVASSMLHE